MPNRLGSSGKPRALTVANDEDFIWTVEYIRRAGYEQRFAGRLPKLVATSRRIASLKPSRLELHTDVTLTIEPLSGN